MNISQLEEVLNQSLEDFKDQIKFDLETFEQNHSKEYLEKVDMEEIARQTYYLMNDFKKSIIQYLKKSN